MADTDDIRLISVGDFVKMLPVFISTLALLIPFGVQGKTMNRRGAEGAEENKPSA